MSVVKGDNGDDHWDVVLRPYRLTIVAYGVAVIIVSVGITVGLLLKNEYTGVILRTADQVAVITLAVILAGGGLLLSRPRLRIGRAGVQVRNVFTDRLIGWDDVVDVSFPAGAGWARVDLADDEYIPVLAIQALDRERAVAAMDSVRTVMARYTGRCGPWVPGQ